MGGLSLKMCVMPYQSGCELVFVIIDNGREARWPVPPLRLYGLQPIEQPGPAMTFPTIELAKDHLC